MQSKILTSIGALLILCSSFAVNAAERFEINSSNKFCHPSGRGVSVAEESFTQKILGIDSQIFFQGIKFNSNEFPNLEIEYRARNLPKVTWGQLYFAFDETADMKACPFWRLPTLVADGRWHIISLKASDRTMRGAAKWLKAKTPVTRIRLDLIDQSAPGGEIEVRSIRFIAEKPSRLSVVDRNNHYPEPGIPIELRFKPVGKVKLPPILPVRLLDFEDSPYAEGELKLKSDGNYTGTFIFPPGFTELVIPQAFARFGIAALPDNSADPDPFYGIQAGASRDDFYYRILNRWGIKFIRRSHPSNDETAPGIWSKKREGGYDYLTKSGQRLLTVSDSAQKIYPLTPAGTPQSFLPQEKSMAGMFQARGKYMAAYQLLNELDQRSWPAGEYIPFYAAVSFLMTDLAPKHELVGFGFALNLDPRRIDDTVINNYLKNDLLQYIDKFAFHNYGEIRFLLPQIRHLRSLMAKYDKGDIPMWITECGMPWRNGLLVAKKVHGDLNTISRAPVNEDCRSAWQIAGKVCLAKAAGIEKFFVFIMHFFPEAIYNFGVIDKYGTPHRSFCAYGFCANILRKLSYCGDLQEGSKDFSHIPVFSDGVRHVAAVISTKVTPQKFIPPVKITKAFSIDGRPISPAQDGSFAVQGIAYFILAELPELNKKTEAMELSKLAQGYRKKPKKALPVTVRYMPGAEIVYSNKNYIGCPSEVKFLAANLSDGEKTFRPELQLPAGAVIREAPAAEIMLPPKSEKEFAYRIDLSANSISSTFELSLRDRAGFANPLVLSFLALEKCRTSTTDFSDPARWTIFCGNKKAVAITRAEDGNAIRISGAFPAGERHYLCPRFVFNDAEEGLKGSVGISFEIRSDFHGGSNFFEIVRIINKYHPTAGYNSLNFRKSPAPSSTKWMKVTFLWPASFDLQTRDLSFMFIPAADRIDLYLRNIRIIYR